MKNLKFKPICNLDVDTLQEPVYQVVEEETRKFLQEISAYAVKHGLIAYLNKDFYSFFHGKTLEVAMSTLTKANLDIRNMKYLFLHGFKKVSKDDENIILDIASHAFMYDAVDQAIDQCKSKFHGSGRTFALAMMKLMWVKFELENEPLSS